MILGCLLGTSHTLPPASLWPNNSATRLAGWGKPPVITNGKYSKSPQCNQQATAYYCCCYHYHHSFWMEWGRRRPEENGDSVERQRPQGRPGTGKHQVEGKGLRQRRTERRETGLRTRLGGRTNVTSLLVLIWPTEFPVGASLLISGMLEEGKWQDMRSHCPRHSSVALQPLRTWRQLWPLREQRVGREEESQGVWLILALAWPYESNLAPLGRAPL